MAGRGRGRGGGRGFGGGFSFATQKPFDLFPEDVKLPDNKVDKDKGKTVDIDDDMKKLLRWSTRFKEYWKASPYFLEETTSKGEEGQGIDIERYSDKKKTMFTRDSLSQILVYNDFAKELVKGKSRRMPSRKKFRWNPESELKRFDFFENQEKKLQGREDVDEKEKEDEENEDENENAEEGSSGSEIGDDDYKQGEHYDDDEDDYNDVDDGEDEPFY